MRSLMIFLTAVVLFSSCSKDMDQENDIIDTTWVIWQYKDLTSANAQPLQDTIIFLTKHKYSYNKYEQNYTLTTSSNSLNLTIYGTPFGDLSGQLPRDFITYGEVIAKEFTNIAPGGGNDSFILWMKKI